MAEHILVRGIGDIGSAVAHVIFSAGHTVAIYDEQQPTTPRRSMSFADAIFDGEAKLDGVTARRVASVSDLRTALASRAFLPVTTMEFAQLLPIGWQVLVDARMRKRIVPEDQRSLAKLTIGLGPNFVAGSNVDVAVETSWDRLGAIVRSGPTLPLRGEPRVLAGIGRERFVYAPSTGIWHTSRQIGEFVHVDQPVGSISGQQITAPVGGVIRGLTRNGVRVERNTKIIEVDPRETASIITGLGERPRRIADSVLSIIRDFR